MSLFFPTRAKSPQPPAERSEAEEQDEDKVRLDKCVKTHPHKF